MAGAFVEGIEFVDVIRYDMETDWHTTWNWLGETDGKHRCAMWHLTALH